MLELTGEQRALCALIRNESGGVDCHSTDWDKVRDEALQQAVFGLIAESQTIPSEVRTQWKKTATQCAATNLQSLYANFEVDRIMREHGFRYVILKGIASAYYYPFYFNRTLGDCDFLIDTEQQEQVIDALKAEEYSGAGFGNSHHVVFSRESESLEMHFEIPGIPSGELGDIVRDYIKDIFCDTIDFEIDGQRVVMPSPKKHGLIILLHMQHHMLSEGIGLRHLLDWHYFVSRTIGETFWKSDLLPVLETIGLYKYAAVMTKVGSMYFGTDCPEWAVDVDENLADEVMADIMSGGNFGRKNMERANSGVFITNRRNGTQDSKMQNLWYTVVCVTHERHPELLDRYPILYPFLIAWIVVVRAFRVLTKKRVPIYRSLRYADERKTLYDKLGVFEAPD